MPSRAFSIAHPGQTPPSMRPSSAPKPKQTGLTSAVATQGRAALDQRRQAATYGPTGQQQALRNLYQQIQTTGTGASSHPGATSAYEQWKQAQGFRPDNYQVTFGQSPEGKYAGWKTEGELKAAIAGRGERARVDQLQQAAFLKEQMDARFDSLDQEFDQSASTPIGANITAFANLGAHADRLGRNANSLGVLGLGHAPMSTEGYDRSAATANAQASTTNDFLSQLNDWYAQQGEPLVQGMETANQIERTPGFEYARRAAAEFGVDPDLATGWFPMQSQINDAAQQRDIASLNDTGMPYSEQQSTIRGVQSDQQTADRQAAADEQLALSNDVYGVTLYPGEDLAQSTSLPLDVVHAITTDPSFGGYSSNVEQAVADAEANFPRTGNPSSDTVADNEVAKAIDEAIRAATEQVAQESGDTNAALALERILRSLYNV